VNGVFRRTTQTREKFSSFQNHIAYCNEMRTKRNPITYLSINNALGNNYWMSLLILNYTLSSRKKKKKKKKRKRKKRKKEKTRTRGSVGI